MHLKRITPASLLSVIVAYQQLTVDQLGKTEAQIAWQVGSGTTHHINGFTVYHDGDTELQAH